MKETNVAKLKEDIFVSTKELSTLRAKYAASEEKIHDLTSLVNTLEEQLEVMTAKHDRLQFLEEDIKQELQMAKEQIVVTRTENDRITKQLCDANHVDYVTKNADLMSEVVTLKERLKDANTQLVLKESEYQKIQISHDNLRREVEHLSQENAAHTTEIERTKIVISPLKHEVESLTETINATEIARL